MTFNRTILVSFIAIALVSSARGQESSAWTKIVSPKNDLSFSLPNDFLVDIDDGMRNLYYRGENGVLIMISIRTGGGGDVTVKDLRNSRAATGPRFKPFKSGRFEGDVTTWDNNDQFGMEFYLGSPDGYYRIWFTGRSSRDPILEKFIRSCRLDGKPLTRQDNPVEDPTQGVVVSTLKTSSSIVEALRRKKDSGDSPADAPKGASTGPGTVPYSKELLIIRYPAPEHQSSITPWSPSARVRLKIILSADGTVGPISVLEKESSDGYVPVAIRAAKGIRFLPAEVKGKPVDVEITREYSRSWDKGVHPGIIYMPLPMPK